MMPAQTEGDSASNQSSRAERELVVVWVSPGSLATVFAFPVSWPRPVLPRTFNAKGTLRVIGDLF